MYILNSHIPLQLCHTFLENVLKWLKPISPGLALWLVLIGVALVCPDWWTPVPHWLLDVLKLTGEIFIIYALAQVQLMVARKIPSSMLTGNFITLKGTYKFSAVTLHFLVYLGSCPRWSAVFLSPHLPNFFCLLFSADHLASYITGGKRQQGQSTTTETNILTHLRVYSVFPPAIFNCRFYHLGKLVHLFMRCYAPSTLL